MEPVRRRCECCSPTALAVAGALSTTELLRQLHAYDVYAADDPSVSLPRSWLSADVMCDAIVAILQYASCSAAR